MQPDEPKPPLKFRKLRIAWSVFWGVACVLLVLLWARSYHRWDDLEFGVLRRAVEIQTNPGHLIIEYANYPHFGGVRFTSFAGANDKFLHNGIPNFWLGFGVLNLSNGRNILIPIWMPLSLAAILTSVGWPWSKQFDLRTLLIATTLVAVVLGAIVYATR